MWTLVNLFHQQPVDAGGLDGRRRHRLGVDSVDAVCHSLGSAARSSMGVYMGVFNFFIVIPEITQALTFGPLIRGIFGANNPRSPLYVVLVGGGFMILAALLVTRVRDVADLDVPEDAVIAADENELMVPAEGVQPVPSTGLIDKD